MPPKFHVLYDYSFGFYSPGICPTGYSKGCDFPNAIARTDDGGMVYYGGDVLEGETVRVCCPNGYTCLLNDRKHNPSSLYGSPSVSLQHVPECATLH